MTEDEQLIIAGDNAEALLENPAFDSAFQSLVENCFRTFSMSESKDTELREAAYYQYQAITGIINTLRQNVDVRDQIKSRNLEEE